MNRKELCAELKKIRINSGITVGDFMKIYGSAYTSAIRLENAKANFQLSTLYVYLNAIKTSIYINGIKTSTVQDICEILKNERCEHNLSMYKLAAIINVDKNTIEKAENFKASPSIDTVISICNLFDLKITFKPQTPMETENNE